MTLTYRPASPDDTGAIARLHADSWRAAYRGLLDDAYLDGPVYDDRREVWTDRLTRPSDTQFVVVAEEAGDLAGFACVYAPEHQEWGSFLDNIHTHPSRHGEGIGTGLVAEVVGRCREVAPGHGLYLYVFGANRKARRFYEYLGAEDAGSELRPPAAGGSEPREIHRYAWAALDSVRLPSSSD